MPRPSSASEELIYQLVQYLKTAMPELAQVMEDFPDSNIRLKYPTVTILTQNPQFTNLPPWQIAASAPDPQGRITTQYGVGNYEFRLQLDLWTRNKVERTALYERLFQVLNPKIEPMGLDLQLTNYFGLWCHYSLVDYKFDDSEAASQRQEWRATLTIVASCDAVLASTDYGITTVDLTLQTPDTIL